MTFDLKSLKALADRERQKLERQKEAVDTTTAAIALYEREIASQTPKK